MYLKFLNSLYLKDIKGDKLKFYKTNVPNKNSG
jgi:hypothetical protein